MKRLILLAIVLLLAGCGEKSEQKLYIYNWTDYIDPELISQFEKENGCDIVYDTYNSNENMLTKVMGAQSSYDIVFPSGDHVSIMKEKDLLLKIDKSKLKNYKNLSTPLLKKAESFDPGNEYSIPYFWGTSGLVYDRTKLSDEEMKDVSWSLLGDKRFEGKNVVSMLDDARSAIGAALKYSGYSLNDMSHEALSAAKAALLDWDKNVSQYHSDSYKNEIQDGTTWLAQGYNGDALQIMAENENVGFVHPKEGAELWIDNIVILKRAEHIDLAYKFVDFIMEANNAKKNTEYVYYPTPNRAAFEMLDEEIKNNKIMYPSEEYLNKCDFIINVGEDIVKLNKVWEEVLNN